MQVIHDSRLANDTGADTAEDADEEDDEDDREIREVEKRKNSLVSLENKKCGDSTKNNASSETVPWDIHTIDQCELLHIDRLNDWDFPIFDLSDNCGNFILSKVGIYQNISLYLSMNFFTFQCVKILYTRYVFFPEMKNLQTPEIQIMINVNL